MSQQERPIYSLGDFYTNLYKSREHHDSPEISRITMIQKIYYYVRQGLVKPSLLNIGSGPQFLEKQLRKNRTPKDSELIKELLTVSIDLASIDPSLLLASNHSNQHHIQTNALQLPFADETFGMVVSNHSIDFIPRREFMQPYTESRRVLSPGGIALFNFHHPHLLLGDLTKIRNETVKDHKMYLRDEEILFETKEAIAESLLNWTGFSSVEVQINSDLSDLWWEVTAHN